MIPLNYVSDGKWRWEAGSVRCWRATSKGWPAPLPPHVLSPLPQPSPDLQSITNKHALMIICRPTCWNLPLLQFSLNRISFSNMITIFVTWKWNSLCREIVKLKRILYILHNVHNFPAVISFDFLTDYATLSISPTQPTAVLSTLIYFYHHTPDLFGVSAKLLTQSAQMCERSWYEVIILLLSHFFLLTCCILTLPSN